MQRFAFGIVSVIATSAFGWGPEGHRIVGEIAFLELNAPAKTEVLRLIALDARYSRFNESCNWADQIKSNRSWDWARPLHYTNIAGDVGETTDDAKAFDLERDCDRKTDCPDGVPCPTYACVVDAIKYYAELLGDPLAGDNEKLIALKFLGHFVGDLHQPLHAGYQRDKGGNDKRVAYFNQQTNLHRVWDSMMIRRAVPDWFKYATDLHAEINDQQRQAWSESLDPALWATESHALCPAIYKAIPDSGQINDSFQTEMIPILKTQLQAGGVRLGALLNQVLTPQE